MRKCVIKIGGSLVTPAGPDTGYIREVSSVLNGLNRSLILGIVVGAGAIGGKYVDAARELKMNEYRLDEVAIGVTRINARLLSNMLPKAAHAVPETICEAADLIEDGRRAIVMGGTFPGHTTNAVAALLAENLGAKLVNCTNVDGVYDKDPNKHKDAKKHKRLSFAQLVRLAAENDTRAARGHFVFDVLASKIVQRSKIETHIVNGKDVDEITKAAQGKRHNGTVIK